jgi:hypothetical protein
MQFDFWRNARMRVSTFNFGANDEVVSPEERQEFAPYATGLNLLKVYDSATHLQMFFDSVARADRISWLHSKLG